MTARLINQWDPVPNLQLDFEYDWQGRRIRKDVSGYVPSGFNYSLTNRILFAYDGWNLIGTLASNTNLLSSFMWGLDLSGSLQGAGGVGGLLAVSQAPISSTNSHFVAYDGNGNVAALIQ